MTNGIKSGFTLLELSIVLVIIGLIVGGVLVGRDLIRAAEIRATVGQIEKFNAAKFTFRTKYNSIPGDMPPTDTAAFGLFTFTGGLAGTTVNSNTAYGNNDGYIAGAGENYVYWRHLSEANLIDGSYGRGGNAEIVTTSGALTGTPSRLDLVMPLAKVHSGSAAFSVAVCGNPLGNCYQIYNATWIIGSAASGTESMAPLSAQPIDAKIDDGFPARGKIIASGASATTSINGNCMISPASVEPTYNTIANTGGNTLACALNVAIP